MTTPNPNDMLRGMVRALDRERDEAHECAIALRHALDAGGDVPRVDRGQLTTLCQFVERYTLHPERGASELLAARRVIQALRDNPDPSTPIEVLEALDAYDKRASAPHAEPFEWDNEVYDGSGMTLLDGAEALARDLALTLEQTALLTADLRNALVPVFLRQPSRGVRRVLALADALVKHTHDEPEAAQCPACDSHNVTIETLTTCGEAECGTSTLNVIGDESRAQVRRLRDKVAAVALLTREVLCALIFARFAAVARKHGWDADWNPEHPNKALGLREVDLQCVIDAAYPGVTVMAKTTLRIYAEDVLHDIAPDLIGPPPPDEPERASEAPVCVAAPLLPQGAAEPLSRLSLALTEARWRFDELNDALRGKERALGLMGAPEEPTDLPIFTAVNDVGARVALTFCEWRATDDPSGYEAYLTTDGAAAYLASPSTGIARRIEPEDGTSLRLVPNAYRRLKRLRLAHR